MHWRRNLYRLLTSHLWTIAAVLLPPDRILIEDRGVAAFPLRGLLGYSVNKGNAPLGSRCKLCHASMSARQESKGRGSQDGRINVFPRQR
jgi:hypothetical protein